MSDEDKAKFRLDNSLGGTSEVKKNTKRAFPFDAARLRRFYVYVSFILVLLNVHVAAVLFKQIIDVTWALSHVAFATLVILLES